jgi:probable HAF family extracellular repeat protein
VGLSNIAADTEQQHAFTWTQAEGIVDLGTLGGVNSNATLVTPSGLIVGHSDTAKGGNHAVIWGRGPSRTADCMNGGWQTYNLFKNQGDCLSSL